MLDDKHLQPQPSPQAGYGDVWNDVIQDFADLYQHHKKKKSYYDVVNDMIKRRKFGVNKYGIHLQYNNNRDVLADAYQQLLDFLVYTKQYLMQNKDKQGFKYNKINHIYYRILQQVIQFRKQINKKEEM